MTSGEEEYTGQARGILHAIRELNNRDILVDWPYRYQWEMYCREKGISEDKLLVKRKKVYGCPTYRPKTVNFVGLHHPSVANVSGQEIRNCDEVWTLNDWYTFYDLKPHKVFNPCKASFNGHPTDSRRFIDWKEKYNESGAEIVTIDMIDGIDNCRQFDWDRGVKEFGEDFFTSTMSYMFAQAIWDDYEQINIYGVRLEGKGEYLHQLPGVMDAINKCTARGIKVNCEYMNEWIWRMTNIKIDWANIKGGKAPYWHTDLQSNLTVDIVP